jgi:hypothetical protein
LPQVDHGVAVSLGIATCGSPILVKYIVPIIAGVQVLSLHHARTGDYLSPKKSRPLILTPPMSWRPWNSISIWMLPYVDAYVHSVVASRYKLLGVANSFATRTIKFTPV